MDLPTISNSGSRLYVGYGFQFSDKHKRAKAKLQLICDQMHLLNVLIDFANNAVESSETNDFPFWNFADETVDYLVECGQTLVNPMNAVWHPVCQKTYCNWHDDLLTILYQVLPSMLMDLFIKSPKHKLMPFVRKIMAMAEVIKFFNHNNFIFANSNYFGVIDRYVDVEISLDHQWALCRARISILRQRKMSKNIFVVFIPTKTCISSSHSMTAYDKKYFICDPRVVNWRKYYIVYVLGARLHLLRDSFDNYKAACKRAQKLKILHYVVKTFFICLLLFAIYAMAFAK